MAELNKNKMPLVTVLLPVYNSEGFLALAIRSILDQTFSNFEFLIINDGSTDGSEKIILSFKDERIVYVKNEKNIGIIDTLNKGINLAKGKFIARMDGDDISLPERLEIQLSYFEKDPDAVIVCSPVSVITLKGNPGEDWEADIRAKTPEEIKNTLTKENCVAHPTVMIKMETAKKYLFNKSQKPGEDWDLWMRISSDGKKIVKTSEKLLKYRLNPKGMTILGKTEKPVELSVIKVKRIFLFQQFLKMKINLFWFKVFYSTLRSIGRHYKLNVIPRFLRNCKRLLTISPFKVKKQFSLLVEVCSKQSSVDLFFFFPYCHIGGAEKVHADIVNVFSDKKIIVFFTTISHKDDFLFMFQKSAPSLNVGYCLNSPMYAKRTKKIIFDLIEKQNKTAVFGCNNVFFYDSVLKFKKNVRVFDLMHDFRIGNEKDITHQWADQYFRCEKRIFISNKAIEQMKKFYAEKFADSEEYEKLKLITNSTFIPETVPVKDYNGVLKVLYVGRNTSEKRAHIVGRLAKKCKGNFNNIEFTAVGELENVIPGNCREFLKCTGPIVDFELLKKYYEECHIILITSEREGFPLTIMEGMAHGLVPVSTPVGDVPFHVKIDFGFVTTTIEEEAVVNEMTEKIKLLLYDRDSLKKMSFNSFSYAKNNFSKDKFVSSYKNTVQI